MASVWLRWAGALAAVLLLAPALLRGAETATPAAPVLVPAARQAQEIVVITIKGEIDQVTVKSVERRVREAERLGAGAMVFEIDSPGGHVGAVLEISKIIKNSSISNTVAWIHSDAYSGGAIVAIACGEIVASEHASFGDAAPIQIAPIMGLRSLPETERQKILSPLIAEVVNSARRNGYDENLVQAMLMLDVELWLIENTDTGEQRFVTEREWRAVMDGDPPRVRATVSAGPAKGGSDQEEPSAAPQRRETPERAETGTLQGEYEPPSDRVSPETVRDVLMAIQEAPTRAPLSESDRGKWRFVEYATDGRTLLVLGTAEMQRFGLATATVRNDDQLKAYFGASTLVRLNENWSEKLVRLMTHMVVRGVLVVVFLLAMFMELASPGLSIPGAVAAACLVGLLAPPLLIGAAGWWTVVAVGLGIALIVLEIFVIPGVAVAGLLGVALLIAGLVGSFMGGASSVSDGVVHGLAIVLLAFFVAGVGMYFVGKFYGSFPVLNRLILSDVSGDRDEGESMLAAMALESAAGAPVAVGATGRALSSLRPAGMAQFGDRMVDVVSEVGFIDGGSVVRVVSVTPFRVGVEPVEGDEGADA